MQREDVNTLSIEKSTHYVYKLTHKNAVFGSLFPPEGGHFCLSPKGVTVFCVG